MGTPRFPIPDELERILTLLAPSSNFSVQQERDSFYIFTGDQLAFVANTIEEVHAFLCGAFLVEFAGQSLSEIEQQVGQMSMALADQQRFPISHDNDFTLIDLAAQIDAVRTYVKGWQTEHILEWLHTRGVIQPISNPYDQHLYSFTSPSGMRTGFRLTPDAQLVIVHDHTLT